MPVSNLSHIFTIARGNIFVDAPYGRGIESSIALAKHILDQKTQSHAR
jgi:hypothetical protein